jgi:hypothetical protein
MTCLSLAYEAMLWILERVFSKADTTQRIKNEMAGGRFQPEEAMTRTETLEQYVQKRYSL